MSDKKSSVSSRLAKTFVCGTTALSLQACSPDLKPISEENLAIAQEVVIDGGNLLRPVLMSLVNEAVKVDEENVFGFNGRGGIGTFAESLELTDAKLQEIVADGRVFVFFDPNEEAFAFYRNNPLADGKDLIAINLAYSKFGRLDEFFDKSGHQVTYGILLHEVVHNWVTHSEQVEKFSEAYAKSSLTERAAYDVFLEKNRDFAYLLSLAGEDVGDLFSRGTFYALDTLKIRLVSAVEIIEADPGSALAQENFENIISSFSSPEGWANFVVENGDHDIFSDYFNLPPEKIREVVAGSGWYEEFFEAEYKKEVENARNELRENSEKEIFSPTEFKLNNFPPNEENAHGGIPRL